ncbi:hypothetical protein [Pseudomonas fluorescens]|uniref:hypothetical protein n=1 Tax=Pseudomonas fluorescens TaxID=294 RepID=UPI001BE8F2C1|nr:hypothetical protein [Pseudomonas fluorescens]MBT2375463.1 hypothetical protein [Pseudomonas fluorescens]
MIAKVVEMVPTHDGREESWLSRKISQVDSETFALMLDDQRSPSMYPGYISHSGLLSSGDVESSVEESNRNQLGAVYYSMTTLAVTKQHAFTKGEPLEIYLELPKWGGIVMKMSQQGDAITIALHFINARAKQIAEKNRECHRRWLGLQLKKKVSLSLFSDV